ncbi:hypothetical protein D9M70_558320 [compost metagenome]
MFSFLAIRVDSVTSELPPSFFENQVSANMSSGFFIEEQAASSEVDSKPPENLTATFWSFTFSAIRLDSMVAGSPELVFMSI